MRSTLWRFLKLFIRFLFFLVTDANAASSTNPARMTPSSSDETWKGRILKTEKERLQ